MKKSLVALAVLAASGASFAQVSITGNVAAGYKQAIANDGQTTSGMGVDRAELNFGVSEDLGGGLKAKAQLGLTSTDRSLSAGDREGYSASTTGKNAAAQAGDTKIGLSGSFGDITLANELEGGFLSQGLANKGFEFDNKLFGQRIVRDSAVYTSPKLAGSFNIHVGMFEPQENNGLGLGVADTAQSTARAAAARQRANLVGVNYTAGKLQAVAQYFSFNVENTAAASLDSDNQLRVAASYNFGPVVLAGGVDNLKYVNGSKVDSLVSVAVPFGKLTLAANYGESKTSGLPTAANNGNRTGYGLVAAYALSKRTGLEANYGRWDAELNQTPAATSARSEANILVKHAF